MDRAQKEKVVEELGQIFEECGRSLVASPLFSSVVLAGGCVLAGGNPHTARSCCSN